MLNPSPNYLPREVTFPCREALILVSQVARRPFQERVEPKELSDPRHSREPPGELTISPESSAIEAWELRDDSQEGSATAVLENPLLFVLTLVLFGFRTHL